MTRINKPNVELFNGDLVLGVGGLSISRGRSLYMGYESNQGKRPIVNVNGPLSNTLDL